MNSAVIKTKSQNQYIVLHVSFRILYVRIQCILDSLWMKVMTFTAPVRTLTCPAQGGERYSPLFDSTLGSRVLDPNPFYAPPLLFFSEISFSLAQFRAVKNVSCLLLYTVVRGDYWILSFSSSSIEFSQLH